MGRWCELLLISVKRLHFCTSIKMLPDKVIGVTFVSTGYQEQLFLKVKAYILESKLNSH